MIRLIFCKYVSGDINSTRLAVELGNKNRLTYLLDNKLLGPEERTLIRQAASQLSKLEDIDDIVAWLKDNIPHAMKAFKTFRTDQVTILNAYPLKSLG